MSRRETELGKKEIVILVACLLGIAVWSWFVSAKFKPEPTAESTEAVISVAVADETNISPYETEKPLYGAYSKVQSIEEYILESDFKPIDCDLPLELQEYTYFIADKYHIDFTLVMSVMWQESKYVADVISDSGDYGLMQINKVNHKWISETLGVDDFLNPEQNIEAGIFVLWTLFQKYDGNTSMVLMAYNMGERNARSFWESGIYESAYSRSILAHMEELNGN